MANDQQASSLPPISSLPKLPTSDRAAVLDLLFEPSTQLHTLSVALLQEKTFAAYNDLVASIGLQLTDLAESNSTSDLKWVEKILAAHPRLGEKNIPSTQSRSEQAQLHSGEVGEENKLARLNKEYEEVFPGLRYVQVQWL